MLVLSLLFIIAFVSYLFMGFLVLFPYKIQKEERKLRLSFLFICLLYAWWSLSYYFLINSADISGCWFWFRLSIPSLALFPAAILQFFLLLTGKYPRDKRWIAIIFTAIYLPGILFTFQGLTGVLTVQDFIKTGLGWQSVHSVHNPWYTFYSLYYILFLLGSAFLTALWWKTTRSIRYKKQARIMLITTAATLLINLIIETVLPLLHINMVPRIAQIVTLIWISGIAYAMVKYKLMVLTPEIAADEILSKMVDVMLLTDNDGKIILANRQTYLLLGYVPMDFINQTLDMIIDLPDFLKTDFQHMRKNIYPDQCLRVNLKHKKGYGIPVSLSISGVKDNAGEMIGAVIVAEDKRMIGQLEEEVMRRTKAEEMMRKLNYELEKKVETRTAELLKLNEQLVSEMAERKKVDDHLFTAYTRIKGIFEASPSGIVVLDMKGSVEDCNSAILEINGVNSKDELTGKNFIGFVAPEEVQKANDYFQTTVIKGRITNQKITLRNFNGKIFPCSVSMNILKDYWGQATGVIVFIIKQEEMNHDSRQKLL